MPEIRPELTTSPSGQCALTPDSDRYQDGYSTPDRLRGPARPGPCGALSSVAMLCDLAVKHFSQGLAFPGWLDIGSAHDIGCGKRLAVQAVVRVIIWFHRCTSQGYASEHSLGPSVGQNVGIRCTGDSGARARRCRRIRAHLGLSVQNLLHHFWIHEQKDKVSGRATYLQTNAGTA